MLLLMRETPWLWTRSSLYLTKLLFCRWKVTSKAKKSLKKDSKRKCGCVYQEIMLCRKKWDCILKSALLIFIAKSGLSCMAATWTGWDNLFFNDFWIIIKVHLILKQCLHDLHFMKTRSCSPNLSKQVPPDISWRTLLS